MKVDRNFKLGDYYLEHINGILCSGDLNPKVGLDKRIPRMNKYLLVDEQEFLNYLKKFIRNLISEINIYKLCLNRKNWGRVFCGAHKDDKAIKNSLLRSKESLKLVIKDYRWFLKTITKEKIGLQK